MYRTERTGTSGGGGGFSYTIPHLLVGETYTLRLHFAEIYWEAANQRIFDLRINGAEPPALDDYDVFVESGDQGSATEQVIIEEFNVTANAGGELVLDFTASVDNAKVSALELIGEFSEPSGPRVLFVRGADRSGGFLEAGNDSQRTEHLTDIFNASTSGGNHGWAELRMTLEEAGFLVEQITETAENASGPSNGIHIDFETMDLSVYDAIVLGSNNAVYDTAAVDAVEDYIRGGGSALFISDANYGSDWADASNSDQQFLDRFGLIMHQDQGTYSLVRSEGDFAAPDHPILTGVDRFDGEGVTPIEIGNLTGGVNATIVAGAKGSTRLNEPPFGGNNQGPSRASNPAIDAALLVASAGEGKIAGHFDRNTFFNLNGAGTNINRFDNRQYALNLFGWLVGAFEPLPGDYDGSGLVDQADYATWKTAFGATGQQPADGNGDGTVNLADYTIWRDNLGASRPDVDLTLPAASARSSAAAREAAFDSLSIGPSTSEANGSRYDTAAVSPVDPRDELLLDRRTAVRDAFDGAILDLTVSESEASAEDGAHVVGRLNASATAWL